MKPKLEHDLSQTQVSELKGVGKKTAERLAHLSIHHVQDVLFHLPLRYQDRTRIHAMSELIPGEHVVIEGTVESIATPKVGRTRLFCRLYDETGRVSLRFFYANAFQRKQIEIGMKMRCYGLLRFCPQGLEMIHPEYHIITNETFLPIETHLTPIYPTTEGVSQLMWRKLTEQALNLLTNGAILRDILPETILQTLTFPSLK